ncbi:hypothetical protein [Hallerella succinigenes]|uniref:Uncharacterized protein n=1 Tax=Hallerella succinigenes TaxID=1896222 RepID=A0A2M9A4A2_9BACT|nr:hypothetical protein [Hallerella succinigenes]PJJ40556.1 hypothetical protein BGX16_0486 [Hallerella succinigenes]
MKKFKFFVFAILPMLLLASCIFDSDGDALVTWLDDQGFPSNYLVQTVEISDLELSSYEVGFDSTPRINYYQGVVGAVNGMQHDWVLDIGFRDKSFFAQYSADSSEEYRSAFLALYPDSGFYDKARFKLDSLPLKETLELTFSWIIETGEGSAFVDSLGNIQDSLWVAGLRESFKKATSADTTYKVKISSLDSALKIDLPHAFYEDLAKVTEAARVQLRISAPEAQRLYRFYGPGADVVPFLRVKRYTQTTVSDGDTTTRDIYKNIWAFRSAIISSYKDECSDCIVLHGGVLESLLVEIPSERIMSALNEFYGDEFPYTEGDSNDVRQAVVLAQLKMGRSSSTEGSELGFPVQVVAATFVDSNGVDMESSETYKLNREYIKKYGHPNLVFMEGDTLGLQLTQGMRSFINHAGKGAKMRVVLRMGYSMLAPYDTLYYDHITDDGDSVYIFMDYQTYSRYDFTDYISQPMNLKLWLATKRGDDE